MYRLVVYALVGYSGLAIVLALLDKLSFSPTDMLLSLGILLGSAYAADRSLGRLFRIPNNMESWLITALILFLILQPASSEASFIALGLAGAFSSASKFVLTWNRKHIFNPAAAAAALVSLMSLQPTTWWIGSSIFWPFTLLIGLTVVRKIRRFPLFLTFVSSVIALQLIVFLVHHQPLVAGMKGALLASPLIFLATIMLTEPATMPPRRGQQVIFAVGVAVLYVMAWKIGPLYFYPEVALLLGNVYAFVVAPKFRARLRLKEIQPISERVYNYVFRPDEQLRFFPGQYMEWTVAGVPYDSRGNRRTFTIASSPTERDIQLGLKYYEPASAYKATLFGLKVGDSIYASQLAGNFTLGKQSNRKLVFIAGGIGITPFRSMVKYLLDTGQRRDIVLLYAVAQAAELAYTDIFRQAEQVGLRFIPVVGNTINQELITGYVPDYDERWFYISGPNRLVDTVRTGLRDLGVSRRKIRTDHFSGY